MSQFEHDKFHRRLNRGLSQAGLSLARPKIPSRTLRRAAKIIRPKRTSRTLKGRTLTGGIEIEHYWAIYVHDGRRPFRKGNYMVWFKNPRLDPRLRGGVTPKRASNLRHLTREQYLEAKAMRDDWIASGGDPYDSPVIITKEIKRRTPGSFFFENDRGMRRMRGVAARLAKAEMSRHAREFLSEELHMVESLTLRV